MRSELCVSLAMLTMISLVHYERQESLQEFTLAHKLLSGILILGKYKPSKAPNLVLVTRR